MLKNEVITSRNNPLVKWAASLGEKKGRAQNEAFLAEGLKLTLEAIKEKLPITHIFLRESSRDTYLENILEALSSNELTKTEVYIVSDLAFEKISTEKSPQGVISVIKYLDFFFNNSIIYKEEFFLKNDENAIALLSVRDPSNLGAVIRSAVAFGTTHIILSNDCADVYNPKTLRSAMGSLFHIKITIVSSFFDFITAAKSAGRRVFAAELRPGAVSLSDTDLRRDDIVIIGNEGHGISEDISRLCDGSIYIPISSRTESLNASVAAAVFMWELNKK